MARIVALEPDEDNFALLVENVRRYENVVPWIDGVRVLTLETHDRIVPGCSRAFYLATTGFHRFEYNGEKVTAYR